MLNVSVIIPTWNREKTIEKAIRSALQQTISPLEILVCDDGSTDTTKEIVQKINDARVFWIQGEHGGRPAIPRNRGLRVCRGDWIAFLDSDDEWLPNKLEIQFSALEESSNLAISSNAYRYLPDGGIEGILLNYSQVEIDFKEIMQSNWVICSSVILHRSLIDKVGYFPEGDNIIEDYAFWLRVCSLTNFSYINKALLIYCDDPKNSVRGTLSQDDIFQRKEVFQDFLRWAKQQKNNSPYIKNTQKLYYRLAYNYYKKKVKDFLKTKIEGYK